jgi:ABC-type Zn uptake system ZnuABC Zn-binding protein ZnuA
VPEGADLHTFTLTPGDIRGIGEADAVFLIGEALESGFEDAVRENASGPVVELAEGLALQAFPEGFGHEEEEGDDDEDEHEGEGEEHEDEAEHGHGENDPHIWMDIGLAIDAIDRVRGELSAIDPDNADSYGANAEAYAAELRALDAELQAQLSALPENRRLLVTFHDAYGYFARAYGLTVLGFVVEGPEEEPSAGSFAALVEEVREHDVPYIFVEPQFSASVVEQLANETGADVRTIPSDALSEAYPTYIELMRAIADGIAAD